MSEDAKGTRPVDFGAALLRGLAAAAREQDKRAGAEAVLEAFGDEVKALLREKLSFDEQADAAEREMRRLRAQARLMEGRHETARAIYEKLRARHEAQGRGRW